MIGEHIIHATSILSEISIAIGVGIITKKLFFSIEDKFTQSASYNRRIGEFVEDKSFFQAYIYNNACTVYDYCKLIFQYIPFISILLSISIIFGMAFCPAHADSKFDAWLFSISCLSFILIVWYSYVASDLNKDPIEIDL